MPLRVHGGPFDRPAFVESGLRMSQNIILRHGHSSKSIQGKLFFKEPEQSSFFENAKKFLRENAQGEPEQWGTIKVDNDDWVAFYRVRTQDVVQNDSVCRAKSAYGYACSPTMEIYLFDLAPGD